MAYKQERQPVRLFLLPEEHKRVRLAAAAKEMAMSEFCRMAVVEAAAKVQIPVETGKSGGRPRKEK
jgi:hypothetical protein